MKKLMLNVLIGLASSASVGALAQEMEGIPSSKVPNLFCITAENSETLTLVHRQNQRLDADVTLKKNDQEILFGASIDHLNEQFATTKYRLSGYLQPRATLTITTSDHVISGPCTRAGCHEYLVKKYNATLLQADQATTYICKVLAP